MYKVIRTRNFLAEDLPKGYKVISFIYHPPSQEFWIVIKKKILGLF